MNDSSSTFSESSVVPASPTGGFLHNIPLRAAVPLALLAFGLVVIVSQALFFAEFNIDEARDVTVNRCKRVGLRAARLAARHLSRYERTIFKLELARIDLEEGVDLALLCDAKGMINSAKHAPLMGVPMESVLQADAVELIRDTLETGQQKVTTTINGAAVIGAFPAILPGGEVFVVYLQLDLLEPLTRARKAAFVQGGVSAGLLLLSCAVLWAILNNVITNRVSHIVQGARDLAEGRTPEPPLSGSDELAEIDREMRSAHATVIGQAAEVRAQRERYRQMVETLPLTVLTLRQGSVDYINPTGARMLQFDQPSPTSGTPQPVAELVRAVDQMIVTGATGPTDLRVIGRDGSELLMEVIAYAFEDSRGPAVQVVMHDVSERRAMEARREALGHEIANASEREQRRIGQDLHDDICQRLAAVKMSMQDFEELLAEHAPVLVDKADDIVDRLTDAIHVTRSLARGLSPVDIEAGGIGVALFGLARTAREVLGVECELDIPDSLPELSQHVSTQLYRIAQECINNAAKHAKASHVKLCLSLPDEEHLQLRMTNDGHPFGALSGSTPSGSHSSGMGLHIMRYRSQSMDGVLEFETKPSDATTAVRCTVPLKSKPRTS